jgi:hypothetical protein
VTCENTWHRQLSLFTWFWLNCSITWNILTLRDEFDCKWFLRAYGLSTFYEWINMMMRWCMNGCWVMNMMFVIICCICSFIWIVRNYVEMWQLYVDLCGDDWWCIYVTTICWLNCGYCWWLYIYVKWWWIVVNAYILIEWWWTWLCYVVCWTC